MFPRTQTRHATPVPPSGPARTSGHPPPQSDAPPVFVRSSTPAGAKDGSFAHRVGDVYQLCERLGLRAGESRVVMVGDTEMTLQRTFGKDAFLMQTPEEAAKPLFGGLQIDRTSTLKLDMEAITPSHPRYLEALRRLVNLEQVAHAEIHRATSRITHF